MWLIYLEIKGWVFFRIPIILQPFSRAAWAACPECGLRHTWPGITPFFKLLAFLVIAFICTTVFMQNLHSFISPLCNVLIDHLSCGWNVRLSTGKVTTLIYYLQVYSPTLCLSLTCVWLVAMNSVVWLTLISHFVLLCQIVGPKNPQKENSNCPFLLRQYQGVQDSESCCSHLSRAGWESSLPSAAQTPAEPLFAFPQFPVLLPLWMWECAAQEFLPL